MDPHINSTQIDQDDNLDFEIDKGGHDPTWYSFASDGAIVFEAPKSSQSAVAISDTSGLGQLIDKIAVHASSMPAFEAHIETPHPQLGAGSTPFWFDVIEAKGGGGPGGGDTGGLKGGGHGSGGGGETLLSSYTSGDATVDDAQEFNIHINFSGAWTVEQQAIVTQAADFLSQFIVGDLRDDTLPDGQFVDDVVISMSTGRIDGSGNPLFGNVLAQTQIDYVRDPGSVDQWLPVASSIKLDSTDLKDATYASSWNSIVLHEMVHALGFAGVIFEQLNLIDANGNFMGDAAMAAYGGPVPIEDGGGGGTAGSHWDEALFSPPDAPSSGNELMTGWIDPNQSTYVSDTTLAALQDLGYSINDPTPQLSYLNLDPLIG
jgi:hypothetical protein